MKKLLVALMALLMCLSLVACGSKENTGDNTGDTSKKVLRFNVGYDPDTFDPQASNVLENYIINNQIYDYLYREDVNGNFEPSLAERYEMSGDGLVYTFYLRSGLKFADGSPLTASDVKFSWIRALDPANAFEYAYQLYYIKNGAAFNAGECTADEVGIEVVDDTTLVVTLENPTAYFLSLTGFGTYGIVSEEFVKAQENYGADIASTLASGPFKVTEWNKGQYVKFEKNENYWDAANVNLDELYIYAVSESSTEITMFEKDALDMTYMNMSSADTIAYSQQNKLKYWESLNTRYVMVNDQNPVLSDPNVRKALMFALDLDTLAENVVMNCVAATGYIPNGMAKVTDPTKNFRDEAYLATSGDVELAQKYLAEAGYPNGEGFPTDFELIYTTNDANKALAEAIVEMWRTNLGINITAANLDGTVRRDRKNTGDYEFSLDGWSTDYIDPYSFLEIFTTGNAYNQSKYSNPAYDELCNTAATSLDQETRETAMEAAEKLLIQDEMACLPLYNTIRAYLAKDSITGVVLSKMGACDFKWANID